MNNQNLITLDISSIDFNTTKFTMVGGLTLDKVKIKYNWIFNADIKDAIIGENENGLIWYSGTWINGTWENGTWYSGTFIKGRWKNGNVYSYDLDKNESLNGNLHIYRIDISKTHFVNCTFEGGNFNYGIFGNIKNINNITLPYVIDKEYVINNIQDYEIDNGFNYNIKNYKTVNNIDYNIKIGFDPSSSIKTTIIDNNGKILVGGLFSSSNNIPCNNIIRLNSDGTVDTSFSNSVIFDNEISCIKIDNDGKILVGGYFSTQYIIDDTHNRNYLIRLNSDGTIDTTFNWIYDTKFNWIYDNVHSNMIKCIDVDINGKILIGGGILKCIIRLNSDGSVDNTFNINGTGLSSYSDIKIMRILSDNKILVGGQFNSYNGVTCYNILKLNSDGTIDTTFNINDNIIGQQLTALDINSYNKIIVSGRDIQSDIIYRLNINGTIDESFIPITDSGIIRINYIKIDNNDKILVTGDTITDNNIIRLNIDGTTDLSFNTVPNSGSTYTLSLYNDKILVGGSFGVSDDIYQPSLIRLNYDGSINIDSKSFYDKTLNTAIFVNGNFIDGLFNSAFFNGGNFKSGIMNNCIWNNGNFYSGYFLDGEWYNGNFYGGDFSNGNWHNGTFYTITNKNVPRFGLNYKNKTSNAANWYNGDFSNGQFHSGINIQYDIIYPSINNQLVNWYNGTFNNGEWYGGTFNYGIWNNGIFNSGVILYVIFNNGQIMDTICKGGIFNNGNISGGLFENVTFENINLGYEIY